MSLCLHLRKVFRQRRREIVLQTGRAELSYGELERLVRQAMSWLRRLGVTDGERLGVHMTPGPETVVLFLAGLFSGATLVPLNPRYTEAENRYFLADAQCALWLELVQADPLPPKSIWNVHLSAPRPGGPGRARRVAEDGADLLAAFESSPAAPWQSEPDPDRPALLCYTSGTTGRPKGAMLTRKNLLAQAESLYHAWEWSSDDVLLHALPLFHVHGLLVALLGALYAGARIVLLPRFDPEVVLDRLCADRCTLFMGVPTMYHRLLACGVSGRPGLERMRLFVSGSAPLPPELFCAFQQRFGHTILERYGMTEAGMVLSNPLSGVRKPGSVGLPLPGVSVRIVDPDTGRDLPAGAVGEILIRSAGLFQGYWRKPEADREVFLPDGWFRSGDLARRDTDGTFRIVGRCRELIITGGFNVYPREVEEVLQCHPAVAEAAVFGRPDVDLGERVAAAVVLRDPGQAAEEDLTRFCRQALAAYKCPREIRFLKTLPRNSLGKVIKKDL